MILNGVQCVLRAYTDTAQNPNFDTPLHAHLSHLSTSIHTSSSAFASASSAPGTLSTTLFLFTVPASTCNVLGTLHGGATATLFDLTTSIAVAAVAKPGMFQGLGVTRTLNVTYLRPVSEGMRVVVGNEVLSVGGKLAVVRGWIREVDGEVDGKVDEKVDEKVDGDGAGGGEGTQEVRMKGGYLATCEHGKVNTDSPAGRGRPGKSKL